ncbi:class II aldolase/adducin family protein [Jongsikchunia kroppenstedtii]|uniref:class II aldolase/adducin family protein n=1 Tax=Jongsikchunia kroppenstedtii TaxID=1121721 RepID=UPI00036F6288|nr:class II aldolase/adducin family protein [Jongsikchunia kroppenstedtii]
MREEICDAAHVLADRGLVGPFGHVSARMDESQILITPAVPLATVTPAELLMVALDADVLASRVPKEAWIHMAIYQARPDVGAVARAIPESTFSAGAAFDELRPLHGQASWLGPVVHVHPVPRLLRDRSAAEAAAQTLGRSDAMILRGNGAVTVAATPGLAVARMHLLDTACRVRLAVDGPVQELGADDIAAWRDAQDPLLERLWRNLADESHIPHRRKENA